MRILRLLPVLLMLAYTGAAQRTHLGIFGGISNYQGDLVDRIYDFKQTKGAFGLTVQYELTEKWMLRGGLTFAKVAGHDKHNSNDSLFFRNLSFESKISELSLVGEYYVFNMNERRLSPYVFVGLALFKFDPYTYDSSGLQVFLKPLSTEGQGIAGYPQPYSLVQLALPFGGGLKFAINENIRIGAEVRIQKLFTDYLDDVSTTYADPADLLAARGQQSVDLAYRQDEVPGGNPAYPAKGAQRGGAEFKDMYYFTGLTLSFRLGAGGGSGFGNKRGTGCPAVPL